MSVRSQLEVLFEGRGQTKVAVNTELPQCLTVLSKCNNVSKKLFQYLFDLAFFRRRVLAGNFSFFFPFCICLSFISILSWSTTAPTFCIEGLIVAFCNKHQENLSDSNANGMVLYHADRKAPEQAFCHKKKITMGLLTSIEKKSLLL